jgi:type II secretory pathway pseudopilin PulG
MRTWRLSQDEGFSLPEVCVAAGLVATALVTLASLFTLSIDAVLTARDRTHATVLAQQKLEELLAPGDDAPPAAGVEALDLFGRVVDADDEPGGAPYLRRWRVMPAAAPGGARVLEMEGSRQAAGARPQSRVRLVTLRRGAP